MRTLVFDPSGNFAEGSGTTGWAYFEDDELKQFGDTSSEVCESPEEYWSNVVLVIKAMNAINRLDVVVIESFKLQPGKAKQQSWSAMETPQLIGAMRMFCYENNIPVYFQDPKDKVRVADEILEHMGVIEKRGRNYYCQGKMTNLHMRDAIRHGIFFHRYRKDRVVK